MDGSEKLRPAEVHQQSPSHRRFRPEATAPGHGEETGEEGCAMHAEEARTIGQRLREIRYGRGKSLRIVAELAGISESYLSRLERGERPVDRRSLLESLAAALEVAPGELTGAHELTSAEGMGEAHAAVVALRVALADNALDDPDDDVRRPWSELAATIQRVNSELRPAADYAGMGLVLPELITDLHAVAVSDPTHRRNALCGLLDVYAASNAISNATRRRGGEHCDCGSRRCDQAAGRAGGMARGPRWLFECYVRVTRRNSCTLVACSKMK